jgi:hypothetical protein
VSINQRDWSERQTPFPVDPRSRADKAFKNY